MKKVIAIAIAAMISMSGFTAAQATTVKAGAACSKVNTVAAAAGKAVKCTKKGGKLVWSNFTPKATSNDQVPFGAWHKTGDWQVRVLAVNDNVSEFICSQNMFNDGCEINDDFEGVPDLTEDSRWVEVVLDMKNLTKEDASPYFGDVGFLNKGRVNWQGIFQPTTDNDPDYITLVPGGKSEASFYVFLKNGLSVTTLALKPDYFSNKTFYFKTK